MRPTSSHRHFVGSFFLLLFVLFPGVTVAQPAQDGCSVSDMTSVLRPLLGENFVDLQDSSCGRVLLVSGGSQGLLLGVWFAYNPQGDLLTSTRWPDCGEEERELLRTVEARAIGFLEQHSEWANCSVLACKDRHDAAADTVVQEQLLQRQGQSPKQLLHWALFDSNPLVAGTYGIVALAWLALFLVLLALLVRAVRKNRGLLGVGLLLFLVGFVIRVLSSQRLPMSHALLDFGQMREIWIMLSGEILERQHLNHLYLPSYTVLSAGAGALLDLTTSGYFWLTTVLGSLSIGVAVRLGWQLTGSLSAAVFAGLGVAFAPMAILFSNGYNIGTLVGLLLIANVSLFVDWVRKPGWVNSVGYVASLVLLANGRGESIVVAFWLTFLELVWLVTVRGWKPLWKSWKVFLPAAVLNLPLAMGLYQAIPQGEGSVATTAAGRLPAAFITGILFVVAYLLVRRLSGHWMRLLTGLSIGVGLWTISTVFFSSHNGTWIPSVYHVDTELFVDYYARQGSSGLTYGPFSMFITSPALFPVLWLLFLSASLIPRFRENRWTLPGVGWLGLALLVFQGRLMSGARDGIVHLEGVRYMISMLPAIGVMVGVGAWNLMMISGRGRHSRIALTMIVVAVLVAPLATHWPVFSDTLRNPQREFLFAREAFRYFDGPTVVLFPDHGESGRPGTSEPALALSTFRTTEMLQTLSHIEIQEPVEFLGFNDFISRGVEEGRDVVVFLGLNCYQHQGKGGAVKSCRLLDGLPGATVVHSSEEPNRIMTAAAIGFGVGPHVPIVTRRLVRLSSEGVLAFRAALVELSSDLVAPGQP